MPPVHGHQPSEDVPSSRMTHLPRQIQNVTELACTEPSISTPFDVVKALIDNATRCPIAVQDIIVILPQSGLVVWRLVANTVEMITIPCLMIMMPSLDDFVYLDGLFRCKSEHFIFVIPHLEKTIRMRNIIKRHVHWESDNLSILNGSCPVLCIAHFYSIQVIHVWNRSTKNKEANTQNQGYG